MLNEHKVTKDEQNIVKSNCLPFQMKYEMLKEENEIDMKGRKLKKKHSFVSILNQTTLVVISYLIK